MAKYLVEAKYTLEGAKGLVREGGSGRRSAVEKMLAGIGGRLEGFYFGFGDVDAYVIVDLPDNAAATALALAVNQSGAATVRTVVLMTPEEVDQASRRTVEYRAPGR
jgi:uncharacterized protein with GYD domain